MNCNYWPNPSLRWVVLIKEWIYIEHTNITSFICPIIAVSMATKCVCARKDYGIGRKFISTDWSKHVCMHIAYHLQRRLCICIKTSGPNGIGIAFLSTYLAPVILVNVYVYAMVCLLFDAKPLFELMLSTGPCQWNTLVKCGKNCEIYEDNVIVNVW